jgi:hypothetical protein
MNRRLFRNLRHLRLKLGVTAAAALATVGFFGVMRVQTPSRASSPATATPAASSAPIVPAAPSTDDRNPDTLNPANNQPNGVAAPQVPSAPAPRPRPITRTRAS